MQAAAVSCSWDMQVIIACWEMHTAAASWEMQAAGTGHSGRAWEVPAYAWGGDTRSCGVAGVLHSAHDVRSL
eukprot:166037-Pelagomonas_calceolata.AAC.1